MRERSPREDALSLSRRLLDLRLDSATRVGHTRAMTTTPKNLLTSLKITDPTPHTPKPNATVADLEVGDRFVEWRSVEGYSYTTERVAGRVIRKEGIVISISEPDDFYYAITGADRSEDRVCIEYQQPTLFLKQQQTGASQRTSELCYMRSEAVTIYRNGEQA